MRCLYIIMRYGYGRIGDGGVCSKYCISNHKMAFVASTCIFNFAMQHVKYNFVVDKYGIHVVLQFNDFHIVICCEILN